MPFKITITEDADRQFRSLPVREQRILEAAIQSRLQNQPTTPTKAIKRLRPNLFADFELRVRDLRVLYIMWNETRSSSFSSAAKSVTSWSSKVRSFMSIKTIPLSRLETDLRKTLDECAQSGQTLVVEMPDHRLLAIQPLDPQEDDTLTDDLLAANPQFQQLVEKSKRSPRKPFLAGDSGLTNG